MDVAYEWLGLNRVLFEAMQSMHSETISHIWEVVRYAYGYAALAGVLVMVCLRYLAIRRTASSTQLDGLVDTVFVLIGAAAAMGAIVATLHGVVALPRPWESENLLSAALPREVVEGGFPALSAAVAALIAAVLLPRVGRLARIGLWLYVGLGCTASIAAGWHFPADVVAGGVIGLGAVAAARWYLRYAVWWAGQR